MKQHFLYWNWIYRIHYMHMYYYKYHI